MHASPTSLKNYSPLLLPAAGLPVPARGARARMQRPVDQAGLMAYDLGWDYAHYGVPLPPQTREDMPYTGQGYDAGRQHFRGRCKPNDAFVRKWLKLRCSALRRNRVIHESVTPDYLHRISTQFCPVLRSELVYPVTDGKPEESELWTVDRLNNDTGYVAGNLIVMSQLANTAKGKLNFLQAHQKAIQALRTPDQPLEGLFAMEWARIASLLACQHPQDRWRELAGMPMVGLIPPTVVARNRLVVLQAELSNLPAVEPPARGIKRWASCFSRPKVKSRATAVAEAYYLSVAGIRQRDPGRRVQWTLEDAWANPVVIAAWRKLVALLTDDDVAGARVTRDCDIGRAQQWCAEGGVETRGFAGTIQ